MIPGDGMLMVVTNGLEGEYWWTEVLMERCSKWFWLPGRGGGNSRVKVLQTEEQEPVKQTRKNNNATETD